MDFQIGQRRNVRLRGNGRGGDRKSNKDNLGLKKKQSELAKDLNTYDQQLRDYKKLLSLIPELKELIETGQMPSTVGYKVWAKLPHDEQTRIIEELGKDKISEMTQKQTQEYVDKIKELESKPPKIIDKTDHTTINNLKSQLSSKETNITKLKRDIDLLEKKVKLNQTEADRYNEMRNIHYN